MEGKHELVNGKSPQPNKLWAQGQPDPDPDRYSFFVSWASFYYWRGNTDQETVSKMSNSAKMLLVKEEEKKNSRVLKVLKVLAETKKY